VGGLDGLRWWIRSAVPALFSHCPSSRSDHGLL